STIKVFKDTTSTQGSITLSVIKESFLNAITYLGQDLEEDTKSIRTSLSTNSIQNRDNRNVLNKIPTSLIIHRLYPSHTGESCTVVFVMNSVLKESNRR